MSDPGKSTAADVRYNGVVYWSEPRRVECAEAAVVHLSDHLVNAMQIGSSGECHVLPLSLRAWKALELSTEALPAIVNGIDEQSDAVQEIFLAGRGRGDERSVPGRNRPIESAGKDVRLPSATHVARGF